MQLHNIDVNIFKWKLRTLHNVEKILVLEIERQFGLLQVNILFEFRRVSILVWIILKASLIKIAYVKQIFPETEKRLPIGHHDKIKYPILVDWSWFILFEIDLSAHSRTKYNIPRYQTNLIDYESCSIFPIFSVFPNILMMVFHLAQIML